MNPQTAAGALLSLTALSALALLWFGPMRWLATDWARNAMFEARDRFFDVAAAGRIGFDDPNYVAVRDSINASIRFAHSLSLIRVLFHSRRIRKLNIRNRAREMAALIQDPTARQTALKALDDVGGASLWLTFWKSPVVSIVVIAPRMVPRLRFNASQEVGGARSLRGELQPLADLIQAEAAAS